MLVVCVFHLSALNNRVLKNYKKDVHGSWGFFNRTKHDVLKKIQPNLTHQSTKKFTLVNFVNLISLLFFHAIKTHIICSSSICQG